MKILVTGGNGQLAHEFKKFSYAIVVDKENLDITCADSIKKNFGKYLPDLIINTSSYTKVDLAENDHDSAFAVNANGAGLLAAICNENNIPLIHISTDYVFSGNSKTPYKEEDKASPINIYGLSKYRGEELIKKNMHKYIILRVSGVFGKHGNNFVKTILKAANERDILNVVDDQTISPTPAKDIADAVITIAKFILDRKIIFNNWGIYHYAAQEKISWYGFACQIIEYAKKHQKIKVKKINAISSEEFNTKAMRPKYSTLECEKIYSIFHILQKSYKETLENLIEEFYL